MRPFISIVIPSYNEAANLKKGVLSEVFNYLKNKKFYWEVIISDDGSTDKSREVVKGQIGKWKNFRLLENPHGGKPSALWYGIEAAKGKYVFFTDMDQSTPIGQLDKLIPFIKAGYKAIIGSRGIRRKNFPLYRRIGAVVFMYLRKFLILPEINDSQCGFKLFERSLVAKAFPKLEFFLRKQNVKGWRVTSYDVELLHIVKKLGEKIMEVEVEWNDRDVSETKGGNLQRYIRESKEMLTQIARIKLNDLKNVYR